MMTLALKAQGFQTRTIQEWPSAKTPEVLRGVVSANHRMLQLADMVRRIAPSRATVLLRGESGTGKELFAQAIHHHSLRRNAPFKAVNCGALSDTLLESELFGHEKGAFTGASARRQGWFELADGGTLFLDEVGNTSLKFQAQLLRVLQEGSFERLGGEAPLSVDVRVVCATNALLEENVACGKFREDLFYRINVVPLELIPLRERKDDIPLLPRRGGGVRRAGCHPHGHAQRVGLCGGHPCSLQGAHNPHLITPRARAADTPRTSSGSAGSPTCCPPRPTRRCRSRTTRWTSISTC